MGNVGMWNAVVHQKGVEVMRQGEIVLLGSLYTKKKTRRKGMTADLGFASRRENKMTWKMQMRQRGKRKPAAVFSRQNQQALVVPPLLAVLQANSLHRTFGPMSGCWGRFGCGRFSGAIEND